jgi:cleavage and polyadenylation specificity factor subunit 3
MNTKRKASAMAPGTEEPVDPADELMFLCLGGGNEVGRSCHIIQYKGKTVMVSILGLCNYFRVLADCYSQLDAGQHAGYEGLASLPYYDDFDLSTVDVLLISQ